MKTEQQKYGNVNTGRRLAAYFIAACGKWSGREVRLDADSICRNFNVCLRSVRRGMDYLRDDPRFIITKRREGRSFRCYVRLSDEEEEEQRQRRQRNRKDKASNQGGNDDDEPPTRNNDGNNDEPPTPGTTCAHDDTHYRRGFTDVKKDINPCRWLGFIPDGRALLRLAWAICRNDLRDEHWDNCKIRHRPNHCFRFVRDALNRGQFQEDIIAAYRAGLHHYHRIATDVGLMEGHLVKFEPSGPVAMARRILESK
jgi:hypothetical protein